MAQCVPAIGNLESHDDARLLENMARELQKGQQALVVKAFVLVSKDAQKAEGATPSSARDGGEVGKNEQDAFAGD